MIKNLLKLAVFLVIGVLVYNYFFGNAVEKERSAKIGNQVKELFQSAVDVVKDEKEKFDAGKYDGALDKVGDAINGLKSSARELGDNFEMEKIDELEREKKSLQERLKDAEANEAMAESEEEKDNLEKEQKRIKLDISKLIDKAKKVMEALE